MTICNKWAVMRFGFLLVISRVCTLGYIHVHYLDVKWELILWLKDTLMIDFSCLVRP